MLKRKLVFLETENTAAETSANAQPYGNSVRAVTAKLGETQSGTAVALRAKTPRLVKGSRPVPKLSFRRAAAYLSQEHHQFGQLLTGLVRLEGENLHVGLVVVVLLEELSTHRGRRLLSGTSNTRLSVRVPPPDPQPISPSLSVPRPPRPHPGTIPCCLPARAPLLGPLGSVPLRCKRLGPA